MLGICKVAPGEGRCMRHKVGAEQLELVPAMTHRPGGINRTPRLAPVVPARAVDVGSGGTACGIPTPRLEVLRGLGRGIHREVSSLFHRSSCPMTR